MRNIILSSTISAIISLALASCVLAEESNFMPNMSVGQTTLTSPSDELFYGGLGGNQAIVNFQDDYQFSFRRTEMQDCSNGKIETIVTCFFLETPANSLSAMTSKTYRDGLADLEIATLLYPENSIKGDVHGAANLLPGFSQFGKHLYTTPGTPSSSAFYKISGYQFNPKAQSYWPDTGNQAMAETINRLRSDTKTLNAPNNIVGSTNNWLVPYFNGICGARPSCDESLLYPNGRVWHSTPNGNLSINSSVAYYNRSSLIIDPANSSLDVEINAGIDSSDKNGSIGFIVTNGDVVIKNLTSPHRKITIRASIFVPKGNISVDGKDIDLIGSFVAKDFVATAASHNVNFIQDTRDESVWPPGFREFKSLTSTSN